MRPEDSQRLEQINSKVHVDKPMGQEGIYHDFILYKTSDEEYDTSIC